MTDKTKLQDAATAAEALDFVYSVKIWKDRRVYVNLVGADFGFAGDRNLKIFWDPKMGWVADLPKGTMTSACHDNWQAFRAAMIDK